MRTKTIYVYFVSFSHTRGFGNGIVDFDHKIESMDNINYIRTKLLEESKDISEPIILFFSLIDEYEVMK